MSFNIQPLSSITWERGKKRQFHSDGMWPVSCILQDCGLFIHIQHNCSSPLGAVKLAGTLYTHTQLKQIALTDKLCFRQKNPLAHSAWIIHKLASHQRWTNHAPIPLHLLMWLFSRSSAYFKLCWWSTFTPNTLNSFLKEGCRFELHHRQFWVADFLLLFGFGRANITEVEQ